MSGSSLTTTPRRSRARPAPPLRASFRCVAASGPLGRRCVEMGDAETSPRQEVAVDGSEFDALTRQVGGASTRRTTLRSAVGAAAASAAALVGLAALSGEADAKKRNRRRRCPRCKPRAAGDFCSTNEQCCADKTDRICALGSGSGTSTICCGGTGATCSVSSQCCRHYTCVSGFCRM
jgi:hypothetical protein